MNFMTDTCGEFVNRKEIMRRDHDRVARNTRCNVDDRCAEIYFYGNFMNTTEKKKMRISNFLNMHYHLAWKKSFLSIVWRSGCCDSEILLNYFSILKIILRQSLSCIWTISHQINYIIQIDSRLLNNICKNLKFERIHEMNSLPRFIHSSIIYMCVYLTTKSSIKIFPISYTDFLLLLNITTDLQKWNSRVHQVSFRRTERHVVHEGTGCNSLPRCGYPTVLPV